MVINILFKYFICFLFYHFIILWFFQHPQRWWFHSLSSQAVWWESFPCCTTGIYCSPRLLCVYIFWLVYLVSTSVYHGFLYKANSIHHEKSQRNFNIHILAWSYKTWWFVHGLFHFFRNIILIIQYHFIFTSIMYRFSFSLFTVNLLDC